LAQNFGSICSELSHERKEQSSQRRMVKFLALSLLSATAAAMELTEANWDKEVAGKTVFIKFLAPW